MKLFVNALVFIFNRYLLKKPLGEAVKIFASSMGITYIKFAQILAAQNIGNLFTEKDRKDLEGICDCINKIPFREIEKELKNVYGDRLYDIFPKISKKPIGSASVSQVHRAKLYTGEDVVIKVKRKDVCVKLNHDIKIIKRIVKYFGWVIGFKNRFGGNHALSLYFKWIMEETDFEHEAQNIISYNNFAGSVNGHVKDTVNIVVPKVYEQYCSDTVIVMEYVPYKPLSRYKEVNKELNDKIIKAFNSYIKLSFYALLNNKKVVFHGDPHFGNIYLDDKGNIGFFDMGLIFELSETDAALTKEFFFSAFLGKSDHLYNMLLPSMSNMTPVQRKEIREDIEIYCKTIHKKVLTAYFTDMIWVCFKYDIDPPEFLFGMAKAFIYLSGANNVFFNSVTGFELLKQQVSEFLTDAAQEYAGKVIKDSIKEMLDEPDLKKPAQIMTEILLSVTEKIKYFI